MVVNVRCTLIHCVKKTNYGGFLDGLLLIMKKLIKQLKRISIKISRHNMSIRFNETCLNEDIREILCKNGKSLYVTGFVFRTSSD